MRVDPLQFVWDTPTSGFLPLNPLLYALHKIHFAWRLNFEYQRLFNASEEDCAASIFGLCMGQLLEFTGGAVPLKLLTHIVVIIDLKMALSEQYIRTEKAFQRLQDAFLSSHPFPVQKIDPHPLWKRLSASLLDPSESDQISFMWLTVSGNIHHITKALFDFLGELFEFLNLAALFAESFYPSAMDNPLWMAKLINSSKRLIQECSTHSNKIEEAIRTLSPALISWLQIDPEFLLRFREREEVGQVTKMLEGIKAFALPVTERAYRIQTIITRVWQLIRMENITPPRYNGLLLTRGPDEVRSS